MPKVNFNVNENQINTLPSIIREEMSYDINEINKIVNNEIIKLNASQKNIFETIIKRTKSNTTGIIKK